MPDVSLIYRGRKRHVIIPKKATVSDLLAKAGINKQTVLIKVNDKLVPDDERLNGGECVEALVIVSGG